jgi:hypothetical protein
MPRQTILLLDQLSALGFTDEDFASIHHSPRGETIGGMRRYCEGLLGSFQAGAANEQVRKRLELVLAAFRSSGFSSPAKPGVFRTLCQDAVRQIPIRQSSRR